MGVTGGMKIIKYSVFAFNFIFWLIGIILLAVGIWAIASPDINSYYNEDWEGKEYAQQFLEQARSASIVCIVCGVFTAVTGFLGCCGALKESKILLILFVIILGCLLCILVAIGIYALVKKDTVWEDFEDLLRKEMRIEIKYMNENPDRNFRGFVGLAEKQLRCCGENGTGDYVQAAANQTSNTKYICQYKPDRYKNFNGTFITEDGIPGCAGEFIAFCQDNVKLLGGIALGLGLVLILGIVFALCLCCAIGKEEYV